MNQKTIKLLAAACFASVATLQAAPANSALPGTKAKPNVVILLSDDLGWSDLSIHKGTNPTPNIDRLFREGVELRNFMGWAVCSPSRAMLLTGRHPLRVGTAPEVGGELNPEETTIAEAFKANGYVTGIFGKWHNGEDPDTPEYRKAFEEAWKSLPSKKLVGGHGVNVHGFDEAWVYYGGGADYWNRRTVGGKGPVSWWHNREYRPQDVGHTEDLITEHVLDFLRTNKDKPFFCYVPFHVVHSPLQAKDTDLNAIDAKVTDETKRSYAALVHAMDGNIARIMAELVSLGLRENTIVMFSSDNGATKDGSNLPFRGTKHTLYEGGVHLPTAIQWPAVGLKGGKTWDGLCGFLDVFPTLIDMAGLQMPKTRPLDGKSIWPSLRTGAPSPQETYYLVWRNYDAIRNADWKLLRYADHNELFDLRKDIEESNNVAQAHPDVVKKLLAQMGAWTTSLGITLSHLPAPAKFDTKPAPDGEVLEVTATVTAKAKPKDRLVIPLASMEGHLEAGDVLEFDVAVGKGSLPEGFFYSPFKGPEATADLTFGRGNGLDQFGREQANGPVPKGGPGVWEHRAIGLCNFGPGGLPRHGLVLTGRKPGTFTVYLDNLQIRHVDGTLTPIWTGAKDSRFHKAVDTDLFQNVKVRNVDLKEVASAFGPQPR